MPLAEASTLTDDAQDVHRINRLHAEAYDPTADRTALETLADHCQCYSPIAALEANDPPEALLLDLTGLEHLFPSELRLGRTILRDFNRRGFNAQIAVADTVGAAWGLARFARRRSYDSQAQDTRLTRTKYATSPSTSPQNDKPRPPVSGSFDVAAAFRSGNGQAQLLCAVPSERLGAALDRLPIEALRLPESMLRTLHHLGLDRIGQLETLPRKELAARFDDLLLLRLDQAYGRTGEALAGHYALPELEAERVLEHPTPHRNTIEVVLCDLIARVASQLSQRGMGAIRLDCRLSCAPAEDVGFSVGLFLPTASANHLADLAKTRLERLRLPAAVTRIVVRAAVSASLKLRQKRMFSDETAEPSPCELGKLVERLSSRLGARAVVRPQPTNEAQPEWAYHYRALVGRIDHRRRRQGGGRGGSARRRGSIDGAIKRPLFLLARPAAVSATAVMPDGPPLRFELNGQSYQMACCWGPEQIETGWWRSRMVGRDYYRVETTTGHRFWLFRRLRDRRWFLHGMFE